MDTTRLKREIHVMPEDVKTLLEKENLMEAYLQRPPYQQNDYIGWIGRAKLAATREKRIAQMMSELHAGDVYMRMAWRRKHE